MDTSAIQKLSCSFLLPSDIFSQGRRLELFGFFLLMKEPTEKNYVLATCLRDMRDISQAIQLLQKELFSAYQGVL